MTIWDADGRVRDHRGAAPIPAFDLAEGFVSLQLGTPPRAYQGFSRWSTAGERRKVTVLIDAALRDDLAWDIAGDMAEPGLWLLPLAIVVLGLVVRRGLRPLRELSAEVRGLDVHRPSPLTTGGDHPELHALAGAIDTLAGRYQDALRREQQLANEFAHELRTPLTSIALQAHVLRAPLGDAERAAALQRLEADALRAGAVLNDLLALARADRAELEERQQRVDLGATARRVAAEFAQAASDAGQDLGVGGDETMAVSGHPVLLEIALRNLIENALAHTGKGTTIDVQLNAAQRWLQVCDSGEPRSAAAAGDRVGLGLGLGHRVVAKVAQIHAARFEPVAPPAGFKTCYRLSFPAPD